jgi:hypothetical protein
MKIEFDGAMDGRYDLPEIGDLLTETALDEQVNVVLSKLEENNFCV